jgi:hypothetical protein
MRMVGRRLQGLRSHFQRFAPNQYRGVKAPMQRLQSMARMGLKSALRPGAVDRERLLAVI